MKITTLEKDLVHGLGFFKRFWNAKLFPCPHFLMIWRHQLMTGCATLVTEGPLQFFFQSGKKAFNWFGHSCRKKSNRRNLQKMKGKLLAKMENKWLLSVRWTPWKNVSKQKTPCFPKKASDQYKSLFLRHLPNVMMLTSVFSFLSLSTKVVRLSIQIIRKSALTFVKSQSKTKTIVKCLLGCQKLVGRTVDAKEITTMASEQAVPLPFTFTLKLNWSFKNWVLKGAEIVKEFDT